MNRDDIERLIAMMASENDTDAVMGLRGLQGLLRVEGIDFKQARAGGLAQVQAASVRADAPAPTIEMPAPAKAPAGIVAAGVPHCTANGGDLTLAIAGGQREVISLPALAAQHAGLIADSLTDAIVAAIINKSRMKLKLVDNRNSKGEVIETVLRAEYERDGMMPVQIWTNARGEVAALAAVLRKGLGSAAPDLMAA